MSDASAPDDTAAPDLAAELAAIQVGLAALAANPAPDQDQLDRLASRARALTSSDDSRVAGEAQRLELQALGVMLAYQAAILRRLARQLQEVARLLPPPQPELN
jgi:hypothetical protein